MRITPRRFFVCLALLFVALIWRLLIFSSWSASTQRGMDFGSTEILSGLSVVKKGTIFVSLASYRDKHCRRTIVNLFQEAADPASIVVGLVEQRYLQEASCIHPERRSQIRSIVIAPQDAKGPTYARYLAGLLYEKEDYFLMIDSHCIFAFQWDAVIITMYRSLRDKGVKKPIISHHPHSTDYYNKPSMSGVRLLSYLCYAKYDSDRGFLILSSVLKQVSNAAELLHQPFVGGGLIFANATMLDEVPFDPHLPFLFHGEEILLSAKLWTHGYDFFCPNRNVLFHYYHRADEPSLWNDFPTSHWTDRQEQSEKRVQYLLQSLYFNSTKLLVDTWHESSMDTIYHLGRQRTITQYWQFIGGDPVARTFDRRKWGC